MIRKSKVIELTILIAILSFAFYISYIPHVGYSYPLHIDEWYHYGMSQALTEEQGLGFEDPFFGETIIEDHPEAGFHIFINQIKLFTGLPLIDIFRFLPAFIFSLTAFTAYIFGRRGNYGLEAAFFVTMIPTTVRILGPSFLVPVSLGIAFIPLILFTLQNFKMDIARAFFFLLFLSFILIMHPPTGLAASIITGVYVIITSLKHGKGRALWYPMILGLTTISLSWLTIILRYSVKVTNLISELASGDEYHLTLVYDAFDKFGYFPLVLFVLGVVFLIISRQAKTSALALSSMLFLLVLLLFTQFGLGIPIMYDRSWMYFLLMAGIVAGYGTRTLYSYGIRYLKPHMRKAQVLAISLAIILVIVSTVQMVYKRNEEPYYHLVNDETYNDFLWVGNNLGDDYERAVVSPEIAIAFSPIAGKLIYASSAANQIELSRVIEVDEFFAGYCSDTEWLRNRDINIVYTLEQVNNTDLEEVAEHIYVIRE